MLDDDAGANLAVGFAIETGGSMEELLRLQAVMDSTEAKVLAEANRIERATKGMVDLGGSSASIKAFGNAATRELASAARELTRVEKAGEGLVLNLERQSAAFGKTRAELRGMKAEAAAVAAEQQGLTELAGRIRAAEAALRGQEVAARDAAAAYGGFEAAAARGMQALRDQQAADRAAEMERQAQATRDAAFAYQQFELAARRGMQAHREEQALQAAAAAEREAQAIREAAFAYSQFELAARRGMQALREQEAAQASAERETQALANAATRLRMSIDPAFVAQQRFDREMGEARTLISAGVISLDEYVAKLQLERRVLEETAGAQARSSGAQRAGMQQLSFQLNDVATMYAAGAHGAQIFATQSGQVIQALQMMAGEGSGVLKFLGGWQGMLITTMAVALVPFIAKVVEGNDALGDEIDKLKKSAEQSEVTARAKAVFARSIEGITAAIRDHLEAQGKATAAEKSAAEQSYETARANNAAAVSKRRETAALLENAIVREQQAAQAALDQQRYGKGESATVALQLAQGRVDALQEQLAKINAALVLNERELGNARADLVAEQAKRMTDPVARINKLYDDQTIAARAAARATHDYAREQQEIIRIETARAAALKTAGQAAQQYGRTISSAEASAIARNAGFQVNSADRSYASQKALYDKWVAAGRPSSNPVAKPGSSAHEFGNALDIQKSAGLTVAQIKEAFAAEGVRLTKVFSEQGHWHVEWQRSAEDVRAVSAAHREATRAAQEHAKAEENLAKLARNPLGDFKLTTATEAQKRAFEAAKRVADNLFGSEDPLAGMVDTDTFERKWRAADAAAAESQKALQTQLSITAELADSLGDSLGRAFGRGGQALGDMVRVLGRYGVEQERIAADVRRGDLTAAQGVKLTNNARLSGLIDLTDAAKGLFKEHSKGYDAMMAAEKALTIVQLARTAIDVAGGAARMFASLGPFAFPAVAAMLGVMASLGFGRGGSAGSYKPPETNTGTGTVLGDSKAQSESVKRSIDALKDVDTLMLTASREMAVSLKSIDSQIGSFAAKIAQAGNVNASADVATGFKTDTTGKVLSSLIDPTGLMSKIPIIGGVFSAVKGLISSLFGTKTSVIGSGLYGGAQSLGSILSGGFDASYYSDIEKKKKFLGITTGKSYSTAYTGADPALEQQFTLILRSFNDAIRAAAGPLGLATGEIESRLNGFVVNIGRIDLQGLSGEEIESKLVAVFGAAADSIASAVIPGLDRFQKVGEGAFETLVRVASTVEQVTASLDLLGTASRGLSIDAKMGIADQFESVSAMASATDAYFRAFYTPAEQAAATAARLGAVFGSLGLTMPATLAGFRQLVDAQDLATAAGQATYATLLQLAPAFADLQSAMAGAKSAADILSERDDLQRQLLELNGDTAAIRALDLAKLDASNRALQQQVWAVSDAQKAADAAKQLRDAWTSVGDSIMDEVKRIRGLTGTDTGGGFVSLMGQFNAATNAARAGDQDVAKLLPGLSQSLLTAAADVATSRQELARVQAQTAASLEATYGVIAAITGTAGSNTSTTLAAAATAAQANSAPAAANDDMAAELRALREEVAGMRSDNNSGHAATAGNTGRIVRKLDDVTAQSGGDAIATVAAA